MALVLSLKSGQDFFVGDVRFVVDEVRSDIDFDIRNLGTGSTHAISDKHAAEVLPDVFVSAGGHAVSDVAKLAIDAPRAIRISRGEHFKPGGKS